MITPPKTDIRKLIEEVRDGQASPPRLAVIQEQLAAEMYLLADELANIEVFWADWWLTKRKTASSDKATDMELDATPDGKQRMKLRFQLKYLERTISSIKRRLEISKAEMYNRV